MARFKPENEAQLVELVRYGLAEGKTFAISGCNSKRGFGHPVRADVELSLASLSGILDYDPAELVMRARAATPLTEIRQALARQRQHLAFEPPHLGGLYAANADSGSIGGAFMANQSGSRRFQAGAARDHLLGFRAVNGRGEMYKSGGHVIKNVTGYDLSKLLCGSWGTLSVLTELSFKVLPQPASVRSLMIPVASIKVAMETLCRLANSTLQVSGLAFLPPCANPAHSACAEQYRQYCLVRIEGSSVSVDARISEALGMLADPGQAGILDAEESAAAWQEVNDVVMLRERSVLVKLSVPPGSATLLAALLDGLEDCAWFADAAGAWFWLGLAEFDAATALRQIRRHLLAEGGSAVLYKAPEDLKQELGVFSPMQPALAALHQRIKKSFDPAHIFNPGRLDWRA